jgi:hypothetical protein
LGISSRWVGVVPPPPMWPGSGVTQSAAFRRCDVFQLHDCRGTAVHSPPTRLPLLPSARAHSLRRISHLPPWCFPGPGGGWASFLLLLDGQVAHIVHHSADDHDVVYADLSTLYRRFIRYAAEHPPLPRTAPAAIDPHASFSLWLRRASAACILCAFPAAGGRRPSSSYVARIRSSLSACLHHSDNNQDITRVWVFADHPSAPSPPLRLPILLLRMPLRCCIGRIPPCCFPCGGWASSLLLCGQD